ncbi:MAG: hypothetical protein WC654_01285 [Patescibacteria group bacterium]
MRSVLSIRSQRFRLGAITLLLATGSAADVTDYIRDSVANKLNLVSAGVRQDGERAMALYIGADDDADEAKEIAISSDLVKAILNGYDPDKWTFLSLLHASTDNKIDIAIGGVSLGHENAVKDFTKDLGKAVFVKGGYVAGSSASVKTLLLLAPDTERYVMAFDYKTYVDTTLAQPYGKDITRYTMAGDALIAAKAGSGDIATMSFAQIKAKLDGKDKDAKTDAWDKTSLGQVKIDDLSLPSGNGAKGWTIIVSGKFGDMQALQALNVIADGGSLKIIRHSPIRLDDDTASYGSPVRYDETSVTFVNRNGGAKAITRVPLSALPSKVKDAFTQQTASA